jgi:Flp pilus assembly protein TadG
MEKTKKVKKKRFKSEEGQALVEFALVMPLLLMILCGIIDFGWLFYNQLNVDNSAREAARTVCVECANADSSSDIKDYATQVVQNNIYSKNALPEDGGVTVTYLDSQGNAMSDDSYSVAKMVRVDVKINMPVLTFVMHAIAKGDTKVVTSSATFMIESGAEVTTNAP